MKTKQLFVTLLAILVSVSVSAHDFEMGGIYYNITSSSAPYTVAVTFRGNSISSFSNEYTGSITIPESVSYNGINYSVTKIGNGAFQDCSGLTSITIPNNVTSIGSSAFSSCRGLTSVTIPNSVTSIGNNAFSGCSSLTSVNIGNSVTTIGGSAFYNCSGLTSVTIPNSVTSIGSYAFSDCSGLTSITIGNSVTSIGNYAFSECSSLTSVNIPNNVTSIGNYAFSECSSLTSVNIPNSVTEIGGYAFRGCYFTYDSFVNNSSLSSSDTWEATLCDEETEEGLLIKEDVAVRCRPWATSVTIPNSVTTIGGSAFSGCSALTSVTINSNAIASKTYSSSSTLTSIFGSQVEEYIFGNDVQSIGAYACYKLNGLKFVTIPESVTTIEDYAFSGCTSLSSITIGTGVQSIGTDAFSTPKKVIWLTNTPPSGYTNATGQVNYVANNQYTSLNNQIVYPYLSSIFEVGGVKYVPVSPSERTCDAIDCKYDNSAEHVSIGRTTSYRGIAMTVRTVQPYTCYQNQFIKDLVYDHNGDMPAESFYGCSGLASVFIGSGVTGIDESVFSGCSGIDSVAINSNAITSKTYSSSSTLANIFGTKVTKYTFGNDVQSIGGYAFYGCRGLTSVTIPNSVTTIRGAAFYNCSGLTSVTIPNSVTTIGSSAFQYCSGLTSVTIPNSVTSIGSSAFEGCRGLTSVNIGNSVTSIGNLAFYNCSSLTSVNIGNSVTSIGNSAFYNCSSFTSITIPNSVTSIGNQAFNGCSGLKKLVLQDGESQLSLGYNDYNSYSSVTGKGLFYDCPLDTLYLGRNISYQSSSQYGYSPFYGSSTLKMVAIGDSVTSIGQYMFEKCNGLTAVHINDLAAWCEISFSNSTSNPLAYAHHLFLNGNEITELVIPNNVTSIKNYIFYGCSGLTSVTIDNSVTSIGSSAFSSCRGLTSVTIPNSVTSIGNYAFYNCSSITSVNIGNSVTSIGNYAFSECSSLTSVNIPNNVTSIGNYAFSECSSLTSVNIPNNMTSIGNYAFYNCSSLTSVNIGNSVTSIGYDAFCNCSSLTSITIPNSVTSIGAQAFYGCTGLKEVVLQDGEGQLSLGYNHYISSGVGQGLFYDCPLDTLHLGRNITYNSSGQYGYTPFYGSTTLRAATIGDNVNTIGDRFFQDCSSLANVQIGSNVESIGSYAFNGCSALPNIVIPKSVTTIGDYTFQGCTALKDVIMEEKASELTLGSNGSSPLFADCPLDSVFIGRNISYQTESSYGYSPFYRNTSLRSVHITNRETEISDNEFYGCTNLKNVRIGNGVTSIGKWAFSGCASLEYFAFGRKMQTIGQEAFSDCISVTNIVSLASTPPVCGSQALEDINIWNCTLSVPEGSVSAYQAADQWRNFFFVDEITLPVDGDISGDGQLSMDDVTVLADIVLGKVNGYDSDVADINGDGEITIADITALVNIIRGYRHYIAPNELSMDLGTTSQLTVTVLPVYAANTNVVWSSSDTNVAMVDENGLVTAIASGTCTITCALADGSGIPATCAVTVVVPLVTSITLNQSTLAINAGSTSQLTATILPANVANTAVIWSSSDTNVATVDENGLVTAVASGTCTITCAAADGSGVTVTCAVTVDISGSIGGHDYVDLGLPSCTQWATCNIGANSPEEYGGYFAWGETNTKGDYSWSTYTYCNGSYSTLTKYCNNGSYGYNGFTDTLTELELSDDAAYVNWGSDWRMPSKEQFQELVNSSYTSTEWTTQNGVYGRKITSKTNGMSIFLPAAGYRSNTSLNSTSSNGVYWSRTLYVNTRYACPLSLNSSNINTSSYYRYYGESVRPVRNL